MSRLLFGLLLAAPLVAQTPAPPKPPSAEQLSAAAGLAAPPPTHAERFGPDDKRKGELYLPAGRGPFPVAVFIHGGCWANYTDLAKSRAVPAALAKRGVAVWSITYRQVGDAGGGWPGTFEDVAAGVDHLAKLAKRYPLDLKRVALTGHSAGAHLALWAAARPRLTGAPGGKPKVKPVSVVAIDGPGSLAPFVGIDRMVCGKPVIVPLMGGTPAERPAEYRLASPAEHLPLGMRQLLVMGEFKPFMGPYADAARKAGDPVEVLTPIKANHFDIVTPGLPNGEATFDWVVANAFRPK